MPASRLFALHVVSRKWKYNNKVNQHWVEFDESGELTKSYLETHQVEETSKTKEEVVLGKRALNSDTPMTLEAPGSGAGDPVEPAPEAEQEVQAGGLRMPKKLLC